MDQTFVHWHIPLAFDQWLVSYFTATSIKYSVSPCNSLSFSLDNLGARDNASAL